MKYILIFFLFSLSLAGCGKKTLDYGPYSIGRDQSWYPLTLDHRVPNLNAFTNALVQDIAKSEGIPLQIVDISWGHLFQSLEDGEVGGIFTSLSPNLITSEKYIFSDPFLSLGPVLIVPIDSEATSLKDLGDKVVGVYQFDESVLVAQKYPAIFIQLYQSMPVALERLAAGELDGVLMPILNAQDLVSTLFPKTLKIVTHPLNQKAIRLIASKESNNSLIKNFNRGLEKLISSGKYTQLRTTFHLN